MIVAFAGNRIDAADRPDPRFPPGNAAWVGRRLERLLAALGPSAVVGAAAPGADVLVLEAASRLGVPARVVLPFAPEEFRTHSVAECGAEWADRHRRMLGTAGPSGLRWDEHGRPEDPQAYERGNAAILDEALAVAAGDVVVAVAVRPKDRPGPPSITDDFVARAEARGLLVIELDPGLGRADMRTAFVVMPYGTKTDHDGNRVDCESAFTKVVVPTLECADLDWARADQQIEAGIVHVGMLDRLARSDVVVVDTATENANAFYELGARHVLRPGATVLIGPHGARPTFNINMLRRVGYRLTDSGVTDADAVDAVRRLRPFLQAADPDAAEPDSPLYQLFDVRPPVVRGRNEQASPAVDLHRRIDLARGRPGLLCVEQAVAEADVPRIQRTELLLRIAVRLRESRAYDDAVRMLRTLEVTAADSVLYGWWCQQLALAERRLGEQIAARGADPDEHWDRAERRLLEALRKLGDDPETCGIAGGLVKRRALRLLRAGATGPDGVRARAFLDRALQLYGRGFDRQPSNFYTGVNLLTLGRIRAAQGARSPGWDLDTVTAVTRFYAGRGGGDDFWRSATLAELQLDEHVRAPDVVSRDDVVAAYAALCTVPCSDDCLGPVRDQLDLVRLAGADPDGTVALVLSLPELAG